MDQDVLWPYLPTLSRLALAAAIGLFVGIERERRRKEAGLRTFAFSALIGAAGGLLGNPYALVALGLVGVLVILLNIETIRTGEGAEITSSAALIVVTFAGVLAGRGHTFAPVTLAVTTAALLAWKEPLAGFSHALTEGELRSAVLLAILAFVVFPVLPPGTIDPWELLNPREAWVTVILIGALGFGNYLLLKIYGARAVELTGFLGGLVNSTATVAELATRTRSSHGTLSGFTYSGIVLATAAMLLRNGVILGILAPLALLAAAIPLGLMFLGAAAAARLGRPNADAGDSDARLTTLQSPFSLTAALRFGFVFLALQVAGNLAQRTLGNTGFYGVSAIGGVISSASAVASAANLAASGTLTPQAAALGAVLASVTSALVSLPLVRRVTGERSLTNQVAMAVTATALLGVIGIFIQKLIY
ncbi:MAG TPA: DUF4010 domain-containing protein [Gemmatimonadaceae bacterium]|jgi:uncharacterized membrane protein (DUF4010 family)|nr:DUF4010 domain-containing protein [Gemmatimonadaceae bacterium]